MKAQLVVFSDRQFRSKSIYERMGSLTKRFAEAWFEVKCTLFLAGLVALGFGAHGYDRSISQDNPLNAFMLAFGVAILIGWPAGGYRFNLNAPEDRAKKILLTMIDMFMRLLIIVLLEVLMREFEARYAFKAKFAIITLLSFYILHPTLPPKTDQETLKRTYSLHFLCMLGAFGIIVCGLALGLHTLLSPVWGTLIGTVGFGILFGAIVEYADSELQKGAGLPFGLFMLGLVITVVASYFFIKIWLLAALALYTLFVILSAALHDVYYPEAPR